ncbi:hypothetical protein PR202_ga02820 [Eleusine coracana subsp. coracana]|uniref:J domain-containing protein n=1 Tax=Eleusine coracana subsp. coracana TaxID=191504 RepID=A0AAV5BMP2_ELECO|nr:hypothetical protein PR202_ga02820 [Eleusine coracana subsp. coracana]
MEAPLPVLLFCCFQQVGVLAKRAERALVQEIRQPTESSQHHVATAISVSGKERPEPEIDSVRLRPRQEQKTRGVGGIEGDGMRWEWEGGCGEAAREETPVDFDFISLLSKPKEAHCSAPTAQLCLQDYYKILEVDFDASEEAIRSSYIRLALKWHPDKKQDEENATSRFQEINEAYQVLSNPAKRQEYDKKGILYVQDPNVVDYLNRHKGLILTCNGLGIRYSIW